MRLDCWSSVWFEGEFAPAAGVVHRIRLPNPRRSELKSSGYFAIERPMFRPPIALALYLSNQNLYFQAGPRRWSLAQPGLRFQFAELPFGPFARFQVLEESQPTWQLTYSYLGRSLDALIDPTYDALEFQNDHFLSFVAETAITTEWQTNAKEKWLVSHDAL